MPITSPLTSSTRPIAPAKLRILQTADALFTSEGIRNVGIDRLIGESKVTKATFYKHYGSKDRLILDYLGYRHELENGRIDDRAAGSPEGVVRAVVELAITDIEAEGFRGDPFTNAAAEFPETGHPARAIVREHRELLAERIDDALRELGHPMAGEAADDLVLARDGALSGAFSGDAIAAKSALQRSLDRTLAATA
ncbi:TetR/AcrR family transcriptional regulator [Schumannella sp. 10F1B-5-1]|uniref:TetR/AcrR family transcriptional regulator n=1 Tax=Schumannella sp. 10F1B-5-1 TaxID=2590780 RepID=UPI0015E83168|nr:TetR/AcrR family transcriptional regulator [Schumannella sp. 10F1B-5-1]